MDQTPNFYLTDTTLPQGSASAVIRTRLGGLRSTRVDRNQMADRKSDEAVSLSTAEGVRYRSAACRSSSEEAWACM